MIVRKTMLVSNLFDGAKKFEKTSDYELHVHKCNTNKRYKFGHYLPCYKKNTHLDDKRIVPTGPNPLHN
ncbi:hypothetical protein RYX36_002550, partial [Vicia faba]